MKPSASQLRQAHNLPARCWVDDLRPGDVVLFKSGALRTVLEVTRKTYGDGLLTFATFAILRCSWTKRPDTVIDRTALIARASLLTRARVNISRHPIAQRILADRGRIHDRETHCCDVVGVFE